MAESPNIERDWVLFLDLDGTLVDLAPTPQEVVVPEDLCPSLRHVRKSLNGALAIVSGRALRDIDRLLPGVMPVAGAEHGAVIRYPDGAIQEIPALMRPPAPWIDDLRRATQEWRGILVEEKSHTVAVHFRLAPERSDAVKDIMTALVRRDPRGFELLAAHKAFEIRPRGITKARAVKELMEVAPFKGRVPVYVGDDVTDLDGMGAARAMGGLGLHVAVEFGGCASNVRAWLKRAATALT